MISWPAAKGINGSSATPSAMVAPSRTYRSMAYAIDITFTGELLSDRFHERPVVAFQLDHRVAAELLEERVGQRQGDDGLADHAGGGHHADVASLIVRLCLFLCLEVDRLHRLLHGRDRLDRNAQVDRLAVGHPARDAAGAIRQVAKASFLVVDLVVKLRPAARRALEARAELDALDRVDRHHGLRQPAIELAVPVHVAAEARREAAGDD